MLLDDTTMPFSANTAKSGNDSLVQMGTINIHQQSNVVKLYSSSSAGEGKGMDGAGVAFCSGCP